MEENPGQYVKLRKENLTSQPATEEGELNQPVEVPVLNRPKCPDCGLALPLEFAPPQNEPWASSIFACTSDKDTCLQGAFCPCILFGKNVEKIKPEIPWKQAAICHGVLVEGGVGLAVTLAAAPWLVDPATLCFLGELLVYSWWICGLYTGLFRQELQHKYHLKNSPCDPCLVHCLLHQCALCQEHREMRVRLPPTDSSSEPLRAPAEQEMATSTKSSEDPQSEVTTAAPL